MTAFVIAEQIVSKPGSKGDRNEGEWRVWVDDPPRPIEISIMPNGDHADDRWIAAGNDRVLDRRIGASASSPAHVLAKVVEVVKRWREGRMPWLASSEDPRAIPPPVEIRAPAASASAPPATTSPAPPSRRAQQLAAIAARRRERP